jgi:hypothetical protein
MTLQVVPALEYQLETGLHIATVVRIALQTKFGRAGTYTALSLTFANDQGGEAGAMLPHFTGKIPTVFSALGDPLGSLEDIEPERLLALRGRSAEIHVVHRLFKGKTFANVSAINNVVIS